MKKIFLAKIKDSNDRDCVFYAEFCGFECENYFGGLYLSGACFSGFEDELVEIVTNDFDKLETILTKDEFIKLFELNDKIKGLGYGIEKDDEKYKTGMAIIKEYQNTIEKKLLSEENSKLFKKVVNDEKEYVKKKYFLSDEEVNAIFDNYNLEYRDRAIVCMVYDDESDFVDNMKYIYGYENIKYFDNKAFASDLLTSEDCLELSNGRIVEYAY